MTKTELIKTFEDLIEKKAVLLSPYGTHMREQHSFLLN
jgi:hypothetical protein